MLKKIKEKYKLIRRRHKIKMLCKAFKRSIKEANFIDNFARQLEFENDQHFLDWQDELNKISVK